MKQYLQISSKSLQQQIESKKETDIEEGEMKEAYFQQLSKLSLQLRMNSELYEDKNHGINPNVGIFNLERAGEVQYFCLFQDIDLINYMVEDMAKKKIEEMAEAHIKVDPYEVKLKIMKTHQLGCSI